MPTSPVVYRRVLDPIGRVLVTPLTFCEPKAPCRWSVKLGM